MLLLLQILTKDHAGKLVQTGYAVKELTQEDGKLIFGTFELGLIRPPISLRPSEDNPSAHTDAKINFSILEPDGKREFTAEFIPNNEKQYTVQEFWNDEEEDGVDVYIDSIRHFPESVTLVKIIAKVVDQNKKDLMKPCILYP